MKRIIKYVLLLASFSLVTTSCKEEEKVAPKTEGEKTGEGLKKYSSHITSIYQNGELLAVTYEFEIDKQYLMFTSLNGFYYKFDLNKLIYYNPNVGGDYIDLSF